MRLAARSNDVAAYAYEKSPTDECAPRHRRPLCGSALDRWLGFDLPVAGAVTGASGSGRPVLPKRSDTCVDADRTFDDDPHWRPPARDVSAYARAAAAVAHRRGRRGRRRS